MSEWGSTIGTVIGAAVTLKALEMVDKSVNKQHNKARRASTRMGDIQW